MKTISCGNFEVLVCFEKKTEILLERKKRFSCDEFRHYFSENFDINFLNFLFENQSINLEIFSHF